MYLSEFPNVFVQISRCICLNWQMYLAEGLVVVQVYNEGWRWQEDGKTSCKMYLSKFLNVFVQIGKCIWPKG